MTLKLSPENEIIDAPDLNRFRIGDHVIADACEDCDRHEGVIVGIELQRLHGSETLVPSITLLHDGYLTDGFKPVHLRRVATQPSAEVERMREALRRLIDTYKDMQDGDGNPCPDVAFAREVLNGGSDAG